MRIKVTIEVDESSVVKISGQTSIGDAVSTELGWLENSGMYVLGWERVADGTQEISSRDSSACEREG